MPAYRSDAEAEIRDPTVARLRELLPGCRIIHEIQSACQGPNRIDVLAVTETRIAAAEIKSAKDKLDRLPAQIDAMRGVGHHVIAALHAKFFEVTEYRGRALAVPDWKTTRGAVVWGFGFEAAISEDSIAKSRPLSERWEKHARSLPQAAIEILWRDELREIAGRRLGIATSKLDMAQLRDAIRWSLTGAEITREICATLRARDCCEADPPIPRQDAARPQTLFV